MKRKSVKKKVGALLCVLLCIVLSLAACGRVPGALDSEEPRQTEDGSGPADAGEGTLYLCGSLPVEYAEPEGAEYRQHWQLACGGDFYVLDWFMVQGKEVYFFQRLDGETGKGERIPLAAEDWGIEGGIIQEMDVVDEGKCAFWIRSRDADGRRRYHMVYADSQGQLLQAVEVTDTLREEGIWEDSNTIISVLGFDGEGNAYIDDPSRHTFHLLSADGELVKSHAYRPGAGKGVFMSFRTGDGDRVMVCGDKEQREWIRVNAQTGEVSPQQMNGIVGGLKCYLMDGELLYYANLDGLCTWDAATGKERLLAKLREVTDFGDFANIGVMPMEDGVRLLVVENSKRYIVTLSEDELPTAKSGVTVYNLYDRDNTFLAGRVSSFGRKNPSCEVRYQEADGDEAVRVLVEASTGAGPDILFLSREDAAALQEAGAIGELGELIDGETMEALVPGAIRAGTFGDGLYGMPLCFDIHTIMSCKAHWKEEGWTVGDILSILEDDSEVGLLVDMFGEEAFFYNLYFVMGPVISKTPFIRDGNAAFDCREFREILEAVKERAWRTGRATVRAGETDERAAALASGEYLAMECWISCMADFSELCAALGEDYNMVGFPAEEGGGHYLTDRGVLVVSKRAMGSAEVRELVNDLLSLESQRYVRGISIRMDVPETMLSYSEELQSHIWAGPQGTGLQLIATKPDGSYFLEEYKALLRSVMPEDIGNMAIADIVWEEASSYFYGGKDIDTVVNVIQNRVQNYLDERR